jgi:hypothetical protein
MAEYAQDMSEASVFPFLKLPKEIRHLVYQLLLVHPGIRTQNLGRRGWTTYFVLHAAIIFTSQQV